MQLSLCGFVGESGDGATQVPLWPLPAQGDWPSCWSSSGRCLSALSLSHSGQSILPSFHPDFSLSVTPGLCFCRRRVFPIPQYSHNALQNSREETLGVPGGAGQSLVGLSLSDRAEAGFGHKPTGKGWGRGGGERKRSRKGDYAIVVTVTRALHFWGPWEGCGRGRKDNSSQWK